MAGIVAIDGHPVKTKKDHRWNGAIAAMQAREGKSPSHRLKP